MRKQMFQAQYSFQATDDFLPSEGIASIMEETCLGRVQQTEVVVEGETSQQEEIDNAICPGQCSGHGDCIQGTCSCHTGNHLLFYPKQL